MSWNRRRTIVVVWVVLLSLGLWKIYVWSAQVATRRRRRGSWHRPLTEEEVEESDKMGGQFSKGVGLMKNPVEYMGASTPQDKRNALKIRGLVPAAYVPLEDDVERCMSQLRSKSSALDKYLFLQGIQDVNEGLYYAILIQHTAEVMPVVYTPTVGEACQKWSHIYRGTVRGMYFSLQDLGSVRKVLANWPTSKVTTIVVTDGERILGLGDLGVNGMGIPIGKLALYTACAGIDPATVLPVHLDVGTNNKDNLRDPFYLGLKHERERGEKYDALLDEFFEACQARFGRNVLIQFEDFGNTNAFRLLHKFQETACTFNDDIQGTASVALAGLLASERVTGKKLSEHTFLFAGAGEAGVGIAELIAYCISLEKSVGAEEAFPLEDARKKIFLMDSKGLVTQSRLADAGGLQHHKLSYAHDIAAADNLEAAMEQVKPSVLIGVSAVPNMFSQSVCEKMAEMNERPIIFALSNPTSKAECTAEQAYKWTKGKAIFCSGSPFGKVTLEDGQTFVPGQGNNAYIFPGIGLGVLAAGSTKITDHDMYVAAQALAQQVWQEELDQGSMYPPLSRIRDVSAHIAAAVATNAYQTGVATKKMPNGDMLEYVRSLMYDPFAVTSMKQQAPVIAAAEEGE